MKQVWLASVVMVGMAGVAMAEGSAPMAAPAPMQNRMDDAEARARMMDMRQKAEERRAKREAEEEAEAEEARNTSADVCLKIGMPEIQYVKDEGASRCNDNSNFRWKIPVTNTCAKPVEVGTEVMAFDKDHFNMDISNSSSDYVKSGQDYLTGAVSADNSDTEDAAAVLAKLGNFRVTVKKSRDDSDTPLVILDVPAAAVKTVKK